MHKQFNLIVSNASVTLSNAVLVQIAQMRLYAGDVVVYCSDGNINDTSKDILKPFALENGDVPSSVCLVVIKDAENVLDAVKQSKIMHPNAKIHLCTDLQDYTHLNKIRWGMRPSQEINRKVFILDSLNEAAELVDGLTIFAHRDQCTD